MHFFVFKQKLSQHTCFSFQQIVGKTRSEEELEEKIFLHNRWVSEYLIYMWCKCNQRYPFLRERLGKGLRDNFKDIIKTFWSFYLAQQGSNFRKDENGVKVELADKFVISEFIIYKNRVLKPRSHREMIDTLKEIALKIFLHRLQVSLLFSTEDIDYGRKIENILLKNY